MMGAPDVPLPAWTIAAAVSAAFIGSLFASGDTALSSLPEARLQGLTELKGVTGAAFRRYANNRLRILSRWLVARVVTISLAAALLADFADTVFSARIGPLVAMAGAVVTYGTFAEILGTVARRRPEQIGALALRFLRPLEWAAVPLAEPLALLGRFIDRRFKEQEAPSEAARMTENEVEWVVTEGEKSGALAEEPAEIIRNVLDFKDLTAREVMVPRRKMSGIELSTSLDRVVEIVSAEKHSRYPVYRETLDNVVGLLYVKDLFALVRDKQLDTKTLADLVRSPVLFVAESQPAASVLREMRARSLHMSVVSDEFGGTGGIVTLEDILEEIVGEIHDEHDHEAEPQIEDLGDGRFVCDASIALGDLAARLGREFPTDGDFESLGGLLVHRAGRVPAVGSTLTLNGVKLIVREADETRVVKVEIAPAAPEPEPAAAHQASQ
jgi:CBS domain containing-hemolysin-like protein